MDTWLIAQSATPTTGASPSAVPSGAALAAAAAADISPTIGWILIIAAGIIVILALVMASRAKSAPGYSDRASFLRSPEWAFTQTLMVGFSLIAALWHAVVAKDKTGPDTTSFGFLAFALIVMMVPILQKVTLPFTSGELDFAAAETKADALKLDQSARLSQIAFALVGATIAEAYTEVQSYSAYSQKLRADAIERMLMRISASVAALLVGSRDSAGGPPAAPGASAPSAAAASPPNTASAASPPIAASPPASAPAASPPAASPPAAAPAASPPAAAPAMPAESIRISAWALTGARLSYIVGWPKVVTTTLARQALTLGVGGPDPMSIAFTSEERVQFLDVPKAARPPAPDAAAGVPDGYHGMAVLPMRKGGAIKGVLVIERERSEYFEPQAMALLRALAALYASAL